MKLYLLVFILLPPVIFSCSSTHSTNGQITIVQLKTVDLLKIRPQLISLLGRDSSGLEAISMITDYEEYLFSLLPADNVTSVNPDPPLPDPSGHLNYIPERDNRPYPPLKNILNENFTESLTGQIMRQRLRFWIDQLNDFHIQYLNTLDLRIAKKGAAAGYNAFLSGPSLSDITKIADKMQLLADSLHANQKK